MRSWDKKKQLLQVSLTALSNNNSLWCSMYESNFSQRALLPFVVQQTTFWSNIGIELQQSTKYFTKPDVDTFILFSLVFIYEVYEGIQIQERYCCFIVTFIKRIPCPLVISHLSPNHKPRAYNLTKSRLWYMWYAFNKERSAILLYPKTLWHSPLLNLPV